MENNFLLTDELLWDYADGFLEEATVLQVDAYLKQHPEQRKRLSSIEAEKRAFAALPLEKPRAGFADGVMAAWVSEQAAARAVAPVKPRDWVISTITGLMGVLMLLFFVIVVAMAPGMEPMTIPDQYIPKVPLIDWTLLFESPVLRYGMMLTLVLLVLKTLDKYLQQRNRLHGLIPGL